MSKVGVGLVGYGTIGQGVIKLLKENREEIKARLGAEIELRGVADIDVASPREVKVKKGLLTSDPYKLINDPDVPVIIELVGDYPGVKKMILDALEAGKSVVTANKALLAKHGDEIMKTARRAGQDVYYEASVCGTIPIIRVLREGLSANRINGVYGIVNGTCNYVLTEMSAGRGDYKEILEKAQEEGYAERDPAADVHGHDAVHKLTILARLAFSAPVSISRIHREGITRITSADIMAARHLGYSIKLLAIAKRREHGIEARVHPTLIPEGHPLAAVSGVYNAVYVCGNFSGPTLYYGKGAGREPTAAAVVADVIELCRRVLDKAPPRRLPFGAFQDDFSPGVSLLSMKRVESEYYLRLRVADRPGVLSKVSGVLGRHSISIRSVIQRNQKRGPEAAIVIMTHKALEERMSRALGELKKLKVVKGSVHVIRIETEL